MSRNYSFYGCCLRSEIPLSFVSRIDASEPQEIVLNAGDVPARLVDTVWSGSLVSIDRCGKALVSMKAVARFLIESGNRITVQGAPEAVPVEIEALLMGPVAGILLHQRGVLPLHASCVEIGGVAIALTGRTGRGKSTLAAALVRRGARLMSDDICPVGFCEGAAPMAMPGSAGLRLCPDAKDIFAGDGAVWLPFRQGRAKHIGVAAAAQGKPPAPRRLGMVVRLAMHTVSGDDIRRLHGPLAMSPIAEVVYRFRLGRALDRTEGLFRDVMELADKVPVFEFRRPETLDQLENAVDSLMGAISACV